MRRGRWYGLTVAVGVTAILVGVARANIQPFPAELAHEYAGGLAEATEGDFEGAPFKVEMDPDQAAGFALEDMAAGMLFIPQAKVSADQIKAGGEKIIPIGALVSLSMDVAPKDQALKVEQVYTTELDGAALHIVLLAARETEDGKRVLEVYGKDKKPLLTVPFEPVDEGSMLVGLDLMDYDANTNKGDLLFTLGGKYRAQLRIAVTE